MRNILLFIALFGVTETKAWGQPAAAPQPFPAGAEAIERLLREWQLQNDAPWRQEILDRRRADQRRQEFVGKANRFVEIWNRVMGNFSRAGVFNVKDAQELAKAFRELQSAGGFPKPERSGK